MKILFLTRYSRNGGSSRYRFLQFFDFLKENNIKISWFPFFTEEYLAKKYHNQKVSLFYLAKQYLRRATAIFRIGFYDLIVIEKEIFPNLPLIFEKIFYLLNKNCILDYDDAVYVTYQKNRGLKNKIPEIIKLAKAVTVGNEILLQYSKKYNPNTYLIPDSLDIQQYIPKTEYAFNPPFIIGWTGTPVTAYFLKIIISSLQKLSQEMPLILRCIGSENFEAQGVKVENIPWEEKKEPTLIRSFDIGIMPLTDEPFSWGKSGLKIIQYFAAGIPVVASPIGWNRNLVQNDINGFLANNEEEWYKYLKLLLQNPDLRKKLGEAGRKYFEQEFALQVIAPKLLEIYKATVKK